METILCLIKHHSNKAYRGVEVQLQAFLTSALDGGVWSASQLGQSILAEKPSYPVNRRLGGPQRRSRISAKEKIFLHFSYRECDPDRPAQSEVTVLTVLSRILLQPVPFINNCNTRVL
jgi:hypothetical protein